MDREILRNGYDLYTYLGLSVGSYCRKVFLAVNVRELDDLEAALMGDCLSGGFWPATALTMIGQLRMQNIRKLCIDVLANDIPGDFIECGVWRGGACIYMRAILDAYEDTKRKVFVADSFQGLPQPDPQYPCDSGDRHFEYDQLSISLETVKENFEFYNLLDDRVIFLEGWFKDTLPTAPIEKLSILRLDGDMYGSTIETLNALYHKVSVGGYVIIDDFGMGPCIQAVNNFRTNQNISSPIVMIDQTGMYWQVE